MLHADNSGVIFSGNGQMGNKLGYDIQSAPLLCVRRRVDEIFRDCLEVISKVTDFDLKMLTMRQIKKNLQISGIAR